MPLLCAGCGEKKHHYEFSRSQKKKGSGRRCKICIDSSQKPMNKLQLELDQLYKEKQAIKKGSKHTAEPYRLILVNGYIRRLLFISQSYSSYYQSVNKIVFEFYNKITMRFNTEIHDRNLKFTPNSVQKIEEDCQRSSCLFGKEISISDYYEYRIKFNWRGMYFYMGYLTCPIQQSQCLDFGDEKSVGIKVDKRDKYFTLYDKQYLDGYNLIEYEYCFNDNEIFEMVFNFKNKTFIVYHNEHKAIALSIGEQETIWPGFTTGGWGIERITVLDYSLTKLMY